ncbi:YkgJ family cysteine cluster protein [Thermodesulfobacteriota bacterium]
MIKAFDCRMCGDCCYGKGGIIVKPDEVEKISGSLGLTPASFRSDYCLEMNGTLSITTGKDGFCIFYDKEKKCLINTVKPEICSLWPFFPANIKDKDSWELAKDACPGINTDCSFEDFVKQAE